MKTEETEAEEEIPETTAMEVVGEVSESIGYVRNLGQNNKRPREKDDRIPTPVNNLARHNSSPAGLFSSIDVETGFFLLCFTF